MAVQIQLRRDTAANWTSADPTLAEGEMGVETDTDKFKIGDGVTAWTSLAYVSVTALAHALGGSEHSADTLANLNAKVSDATLIDTGDARLSDARTPTAHNLAGSEHSADTLANLNSKISDATLIDTADSRLSDSRTCDNTFDTAATARTNLDVYSTSEVDGKVVGLYDHKGAYDADGNSPDLDTSPSGIKKGDAYTVSVAGDFFAEAVEIGDVLISDQDDPTLLTHWTRVNKNISFGSSAGTACEGDDSRLSDSRTPTAHNLGGSEHSSDTLANLNAKVSDATLIDTGDSRLSDARTPTAHGLGGSEHSTATLAQLNAKVSDATLDDSSDTRTPSAHALGGSAHSTDTLANLNSKVSDATLIDTADSRLSDDRTASGIRTATTVVAVSSATAPTTGQVLKATSGTAATWQDEAGGGAPSSTIAKATASTTTTSVTDVLVNSMTITPASGTYAVWFSGEIDNSIKGNRITLSIYAGGSQETDSERSYTPGGNSYYGSVCSVARVTVNGAQAIEGKWRTSSGTASMYARNLLIVKVT